MNPQNPFLSALMQGTKILRPPKHTISTFGTTTLEYVILSDISKESKQCHLRRGKVTAERPQILTPDLWQKRFEGFGDEAEAYKRMIEDTYGEEFRALEYRFKNNLESTSIEPVAIQELADRTMKVMEAENAPRQALLQGPDQLWGLSVMKFVVEMTMRSFPSNYRELNDRGLFDPEKRANEQHRFRIEKLFREAQHNRSAIQTLGNYLKENGLFADYEDRFFALMQTITLKSH